MMRPSRQPRGLQSIKRLALLFLASVAPGLACSSSGGSSAPDTVVPGDVLQDRGVADVDTGSPADVADVSSAEAEAEVSDAVEAVDYAGLPPLPPGRTFTTRYAAGAARRIINPDHSVYMGGFGLCVFKPEKCKYSEGIHDDLSVTAAAVADTVTGQAVVFVGVDAVGLVKADVDKIHAAVPQRFAQVLGVGLDGRRVVVTCSHSHSTPDTVGLWGDMLGTEREEEEYIAQVREAVVDAAVEAFGSLQDAKLVHASGHAFNHSDDYHASDEDAFVLRASSPSGAAIFHLVRWPSHPTVYGSENNGISADWPGTMRKRVEQKAGGLAVHIPGPIGSVYADGVPGCTQTDAFPNGFQDPDNSPENHGSVACIGYGVADSALAALDEAAVPVVESGLRFRHKIFPFHPTNLVLAAVLNASAIPIDVPDTSDPTAMMDAQFSWISLGGLDMVTTPGESFPLFAQHAEQKLMAFGSVHPLVIGVAQDYLGYLIAAQQYDEPHLSYFRTLSAGETVEPAYLAALQDLLQEELGAPLPACTGQPPAAEVPVAAAEAVDAGPYLAFLGHDRAVLQWVGGPEDLSPLAYGPGDTLQLEAPQDPPVTLPDIVPLTLHAARLEGLLPDTLYAYRLPVAEPAEIHHFRTAPLLNAPVRIAAWGDNQDGPAVFTQIADSVRSWGPGICIGVGDHISDGDLPSLWAEQLLKPAAALLRGIPLFAAMGNHEWNSAPYFDFFDYPHPAGLPEKAAYYSFTWGNVFVMVLSTNTLLCPVGDLDVPQSAWIKEQVRSAQARSATWRIALAHEPAYSESWGDGDCGYDGFLCTRNFVMPLLAENGFHLYLSGHTHDYERGMVDGVVHIITGGGGGSLDTWCKDWPQTSVVYQQHHHLRITAGCDSLRVEGVDLQGQLFDWVELAAGAPGQILDEGPMKDLPTLIINSDSPTLENPR